MKKILALVSVIMTTGCVHLPAQMSSPNKVVQLSWTAPALDPINLPNWTGCGTPSTCQYVVSRAPASGNTCPAITGTAYTPLNSSSPVSATTYTDSTSGGGKFCWIVQTVQLQSGTQTVSDPSNSTGPLQVPGKPGPPTSNSGAIASNELAPIIPLPPVTKELDAKMGTPVMLVATLK